MEKEAGILKLEFKICLPAYKLVYSILFMIFLSLVRGVTTYDEIGITIEPYLGILAAIFCADTYMCEWNAKRDEFFSLISIRNRKKVIYRRLTLQVFYLWSIGAAGYFLFFWHKPVNFRNISIWQEYVWLLFVLFWNVVFWSTFSMTVTNLFRNHIVGIGSSIVLWVVLYSKWGAQYLGNYNLFSYVFRDLSGSMKWIYGSVIEIVLAALMLGLVPFIMKKRG
jgi:hypothetical protein